MDKLIVRLQTTLYRFAPLMQQKKNLFMVAALFWILLITIPMLVDVFGQGPPQGPPIRANNPASITGMICLTPPVY